MNARDDSAVEQVLAVILWQLPLDKKRDLYRQLHSICGCQTASPETPNAPTCDMCLAREGICDSDQIGLLQRELGFYFEQWHNNLSNHRRSAIECEETQCASIREMLWK